MKNYSKILNIHTLIALVGVLCFQYFVNGSSLRTSPYIYLFDILFVVVFLNGTVWDALKLWCEKKRSAWQEKQFRYHCYTLLSSIFLYGCLRLSFQNSDRMQQWPAPEKSGVGRKKAVLLKSLLQEPTQSFLLSAQS